MYLEKAATTAIGSVQMHQQCRSDSDDDACCDRVTQRVMGLMAYRQHSIKRKSGKHPSSRCEEVSYNLNTGDEFAEHFTADRPKSILPWFRDCFRVEAWSGGLRRAHNNPPFAAVLTGRRS